MQFSKYLQAATLVFMSVWASVSLAAIDTEFSLEYSPDPLLSGDMATFTVSYIAVQGTSACPKPNLTMVLSEYLEFVSASDSAKVPPVFTPDPSGVTGGSVYWEDLPTYNTQKPGDVLVSATVQSGLPNNEPIILDVAMDGQNEEDCGGTIFMPPANPAPTLNIEKTASRVVVQPGQTINYTIDFVNTGNQAANNVVISDSLPPDTTFVSASPGFRLMPGNPDIVSWTFASVEVDQPISQLISVEVIGSTPAGTLITNEVVVTGEDQSGDAVAPAMDEAVTEVTSKPVLQIDKTAQDTVLSGGTLNYTIIYTNAGDTVADAVQVVDNYSDLVSQINTVSGNGIVDEGARTITWGLAELAPGASGTLTYTATIQSGLRAFGQSTGSLPPDNVENTAVISASNADDASDMHSAGVVQPTPDINIVKSGPANADAGTVINYTLLFSNTGTADSVDTRIEDFVPQQCVSVQPSDGGTYDPVTSVVRWDIGLFIVNQSGEVSLTCELASPISNGTQITNTGSIASFNASPDTSQVVTVIRSRPQLVIEKSGIPDPVTPGGTLLYVYRVSNTGNADAVDVIVEDFLDQNVIYRTDSLDGTFVPAENKVTWSVAELRAGGSLEIVMATEVNAGLIGNVTLYNSATASSASTDPVTTEATIQVATEPRFTLTKSASNIVVQPGDTITYTLAYQNVGNDIALNTIMSDELPLDTTYVSSSNGGVFADGLVTWQLGDIAVSDSGSPTLTVEVNSPLRNNTEIINTAEILADGIQPVSATKKITVSSAPVLELVKTADRGAVLPGDQVTYELGYTNAGNANATNVVLADILPAELNFVSATGGGVFADGVVRWPADTLNVGQSGTVSFIAQVEGPVSNGQVITNTADLRSDQTPAKSASVDIVVINIPVITIEKRASKTTVLAGDEVTFFIDAGNVGNAYATNPLLSDGIPVGTSFVSASDGYQLDGNIISWSSTQLPVGQAVQLSLTVKLDESLADGSVITNVANIVSDQTAAKLAQASLSVQSLPRLTLSKVADAENVEPGRNVAFELIYENIGTATATNLLLEDSLPVNMSFVSATSEGVYDEVSRKVTWTDVDGIEAGTSGAVQLTLKVNDDVPVDTVIENFATVSADAVQGVTASDTITVSRTPVLELEKTADRTFVSPGEQITYTLTFSNSGNATSRVVTLEDAIPENTTLIDAPGSDTGSPFGGIVRWTFDELPVGEAGSVTMVVRVNPDARVNSAGQTGTIIYNSATIDSEDAKSATASIELPVQREPSLTLTKTAQADFVDAGERVAFDIAFANEGNAAAENVTLSDRVPQGMSFVDASTPFTFDGTTVSWGGEELAAGDSGQVYLILQVDQGVANGTRIENLAELSASNTASKTAVDSIIVNSAPALDLLKVASVEFIGPGEVITYELTYGNSGNAIAGDVILEDAIPADTTLESIPPNATVVDGKVVWNFPTLGIGATGSVSMSVRVDDTAPVDADVDNGTIVHNVATLDSPDASAVSAEDDVIVKIAPRLQLEKIASSEVAQPGAEILYTISYENVGNGSANGVTLSDAIPQNTSYVSSSGGTLVDGTVTWDLSSLAAGAAGSVSLTVRVNDLTPAETLILNTALLESATTPPLSDSATVAVRAKPILTLAKISDVELAGPNDLITFTLDYGNTGNVTATDLILSDAIPQETEFVSATGGGQLIAASVVWEADGLLAGASGSVSMIVRVASAATSNAPGVDGTTILNIATLNSSNAAAVQAQDSVAIQEYPKLNLDKEASTSVVSPGDQIIYTLSYSNTGNLSATNVTLTDPLPEYTSFVSASGDGQLVGTDVRWTLAEIPPGYFGSVSFTVQVDDPVKSASNSGIPVNNIATLDAGDQAPSVTASAIVLIDAQPVPALTKEADVTFAQPGQEITYTLNFANTGNASITNATLTDNVPTNTQFVAASDGGTQQNGLVTWPIGLLAGGGEGSVTLTVIVDELVADGTVIRNSAALDSGNQAPNVTAQDEVYIEATPDLVLEKTASRKLVTPGDNIVYTLAYSNKGNANASNTTIVEAIPQNTTFVSASNGGVVKGANVEWALGTLSPGAEGSVTFEVTAKAGLATGAVIQNSATLNRDETEPVLSEATVIVYSMDTSPVQLDVQIEANPTSIEAGQEATYIINYVNLTNIEASMPRVAATLPANADFVSATDGGFLDQSVVPNRVQWSLPALGGNTSGVVQFTVRHRVATPVASLALFTDQIAMASFVPMLAAPVAAAPPPVSSLRIGESMQTYGGVDADNAASPVIATAAVQVIATLPPPEEPKSIPTASNYGYLLLVLLILLLGLRAIASGRSMSRG